MIEESASEELQERRWTAFATRPDVDDGGDADGEAGSAGDSSSAPDRPEDLRAGPSADFTFDAYAALVEAALENGYECLTVREYLRREPLPDRFVILRHDVDRKPTNALAMARLEAAYDERSTYYFRTIEKTFRPTIIRRIGGLGHEIGYHYEDLDRAEGDRGLARASFAAELARLRTVAPVETVCMHGNPLTSHDNRDLWSDSPGADFRDLDLLGEAYLSTDFTDVTYFSDTGRTWRDGRVKVKDHPRGRDDKSVTVDTTWDLIAQLNAGRPRRLCVLTHPNRWARTYREFVVETLKDTVTNLGKYGLTLVRE